jgi:LmbE family N-acetylglucosaminyl deacetylase
VLTKFATLAAFPHKRVLVVAPHPDDESLGCGGLVATLALTGTAFCFVFVTDGGASHPGSRTWPCERLVARRADEAVEALRRLNVEDADTNFLALPDAAMPARGSPVWDKSVAQFAEIITEFNPALVLLPWRRDPLCDHRASWRLAKDGIKLANAHLKILEYPIWLDEFGEERDRPRDDEARPVVFDVAAVLEAKLAAIAAHLTQTTALIDDDPNGFRLTEAVIERLATPTETYWQAIDEAD